MLSAIFRPKINFQDRCLTDPLLWWIFSYLFIITCFSLVGNRYFTWIGGGIYWVMNKETNKNVLEFLIYRYFYAEYKKKNRVWKRRKWNESEKGENKGLRCLMSWEKSDIKHLVFILVWYLSLPPTRRDLTQGQWPEGRLKEGIKDSEGRARAEAQTLLDFLGPSTYAWL